MDFRIDGIMNWLLIDWLLDCFFACLFVWLFVCLLYGGLHKGCTSY